MLRVLTVALGIALLGMSAALADEKVSEADGKKIQEAIAVMGCSGGEMEKESEGAGYFEVDDAKCKNGQFDIKLDKSFNVISLTRD